MAQSDGAFTAVRIALRGSDRGGRNITGISALYMTTLSLSQIAARDICNAFVHSPLFQSENSPREFLSHALSHHYRMPRRVAHGRTPPCSQARRGGGGGGGGEALLMYFLCKVGD